MFTQQRFSMSTCIEDRNLDYYTCRGTTSSGQLSIVFAIASP
ncbi:MAG: hypothetical protein ACI89U_000639, partial [Gammaproteobacteria bacterium]